MPPGGTCLPDGLVPLPRTGWVATSSTSGTDVAANAIDGVECSRFSTDINQAAGQWLQIDMGTPFLFSAVVLDASDDAANFPNAFAAYVSWDGVNWGSPVATGLGSSSGVTTILFPEQNARYVRIELTAGTNVWWAVDEIKVFSVHPPSGTPVPLPQSSWTASSSVNASTAPLGIDGNLVTRFTTGTDATAGQWFQVNMGAPVAFNQITMDTSGQPAGCTDWARGYAVYVADDGTNWTAVAMGQDATDSIVTVTFPPQKAQYISVQLTQTTGPWWSIGELNVYTPAP
jgi:hypothetical protein